MPNLVTILVLLESKLNGTIFVVTEMCKSDVIYVGCLNPNGISLKKKIKYFFNFFYLNQDIYFDNFVNRMWI